MKLRILSTALLLSTLLSIGNQSVEAQNFNIRDSILKVTVIHANYAHLIPGGDMKTRFGNSSYAGIGFLRKTGSNFLFGADISYHFGNNVKEKTVIDSLRTFQNRIISDEGGFADIRIFQRGISTYARVGKLFPVFGSNKNSGIIITAGIGFIQHKIHIEVLEENVRALDAKYRKGYDRLTNGIAFNEFVGYWWMHENRRINVYAGFDFTQGFTQNRRDFDFQLQRKLEDERKDYLSGFKFGIILPLYKRMPKEYYFK